MQEARAIDQSVAALQWALERAHAWALQPGEAAPHTDDAWVGVLLESMNAGLAIFDAEDRVLYANQRFCALLDRELPQLAGQSAAQFLLRAHENSPAKRKRNSRAPHQESYEVRLVSRLGRERHLLVSPSPLHDQSGVYLGSVDLFLDRTQQKEAEQALERDRELLETLVKHSRDCVYRINLKTRHYEFIGPAIQEILGYSPAEFLALEVSQVQEMVHPQDRQAFREYGARLLEAAQAGGSTGLGEFRMRTKDGEYRWLSDSATILLDHHQQPIARIGAARDVTASKLAERAVLAASRMEATSTLAGGIAHDFNNLMAAVLANAELLEMQPNATAETRQLLHLIQRSAEQAGELAQQMLAFARGGKYQLNVLDFNQTVREVLALESHSFDPRLEVAPELDPKLWPVYADASQMSQVVMNLTINAAEAMPQGGRMTVTTRNCEVDEAFAARHPGLSPGTHVVLVVQDTGEGMPPQVVSRVFEPFYSTKFKGRGLGLAAVYGIVKNHGGHISVYSEAGIGSVFRVYLPASTQFPEPADTPAQTLQRGDETILVVDDEEILLETTQQMLHTLGYQVLVARNGRDALELLAAHGQGVHLVLMDLAMPVMGGAEAHTLLLRDYPDVPVIICSGFECDPTARDMMERGARAFLQKPFRMQHLAAEIRRALDN